MRASLVNIPLEEVFTPGDGGPVCRLRDMLETRMLEYITGAAMMEPDIRIETNRRGFCREHYERLLAGRNRLSVALMMESYLNELEGRVFGGDVLRKKPTRAAKAADDEGQDCFICHHVNENLDRMLANACHLWDTDASFRRLFDAQPYLCLPHFSRLCAIAPNEISRRHLPDFGKSVTRLSREYLNTLQEDVSHFCRMFDYRNASPDADWGNAKDAVERAAQFLTGRPFTK